MSRDLNAFYPSRLGNSSLRLAMVSRIENPTKASIMSPKERTTMPAYSLIGVRRLASQTASLIAFRA